MNKYWFLFQKRDINRIETTPIYASSEQQAKNKRSAISRQPNIIFISPIRPVDDSTMAVQLMRIIKKGANDGRS